MRERLHEAVSVVPVRRALRKGVGGGAGERTGEEQCRVVLVRVALRERVGRRGREEVEERNAAAPRCYEIL